MLNIPEKILKIWTEDKVQLTIWMLVPPLLTVSLFLVRKIPASFQEKISEHPLIMVQMLIVCLVILLGLFASLTSLIYKSKKTKAPQLIPSKKIQLDDEKLLLLEAMAEIEPQRLRPSDATTEQIKYSNVLHNLEYLSEKGLAESSICMGKDPICFHLTPFGRSFLKTKGLL